MPSLCIKPLERQARIVAQRRDQQVRNLQFIHDPVKRRVSERALTDTEVELRQIKNVLSELKAPH